MHCRNLWNHRKERMIKMPLNFGINELPEAIAFMQEILPILLPVLIINAIVVVVALVGLLRKDLPFTDKVIWLALIIFMQFIGPVLYFVIGSKMLDDKIASREDVYR